MEIKSKERRKRKRSVFFSNSSVPRGHSTDEHNREEWKKWKKVRAARWRVPGRAEHRVEYENGKEENKRERKREIKRRGGRDAGGKVAVEGKRKRAKSRTGGQGWMG